MQRPPHPWRRFAEPAALFALFALSFARNVLVAMLVLGCVLWVAVGMLADRVLEQTRAAWPGRRR